MRYLVQVRYGRLRAEDIPKDQECPGCRGTGRVVPQGYTYGSDLPLSVGDVVEVPGNWLYSGRQEATVIGLGRSVNYDGPVSGIVRVVEQAPS